MTPALLVAPLALLLGWGSWQLWFWLTNSEVERTLFHATLSPLEKLQKIGLGAATHALVWGVVASILLVKFEREIGPPEHVTPIHHHREAERAPEPRIEAAREEPAPAEAPRQEPPRQQEARLEQQAASDGRAHVAPDRELNLRACPDARQCRSLTTMPRGSAVTILAETADGWLELEYRDEAGNVLRGFASGKYIAR